MTTGISVVAYELATFREDGGPRVVMGFVVRHPDGVIVVDTGFGFGHAELDLEYDVRARRIVDALASVEVRVDDVTGLINCHLHADHSGQNAAFPGIPTWVQPAEWAAAHEPDHTVVEWVDYEGADIREAAGDHLVRPGVRVAGHARPHARPPVGRGRHRRRPGHPGRPGLLHGGRVGGRPGRPGGPLERPGPPAYDRSIERLRGLRPTRVLFGHDRDPWVA